jgi:hypothetical protein
MQIGDTVLWKGKPAKIFGQGSRDGVVFQYSIIMLNNRRYPAIFSVSPKSKHLTEVKEEQAIRPAIADFWSKPNDEQMRLSCQDGEPPTPLTDEEKDEMAACGC